MDKRFPFKLKKKDAVAIISVACGGWASKLANLWGPELLLNSTVDIPEEFYKEMRDACTPPQHNVFDQIFGKDVVKKLWVTTEDGVDIYEGDSYSFFWIKKPYDGQQKLVVYDVACAVVEIDAAPSKDALFFSNSQSAQAHLDFNFIPIYTEKQMQDAVEGRYLIGTDFKVGDKVIIKDGSYMTHVTKKGKVVHNTSKTGWPGRNKDNWRIINVNGEFPVKEEDKKEGKKNTCAIKNMSNKEVWFCSHINIKRPE